MADDQTKTPGQKAADDLDILTKQPVAESNLALEVEQFEEIQKDWQFAYNAGGPFRGEVERVAAEWKTERPVEKMSEVLSTPEVSGELGDSVEIVPDESELLGGVTADYTDRVLLGGDGNLIEPKAKIPLTEEQVKEGLHHKIWEGIRWLAEWCMKQFKLQKEGK